MATEAEVLNVLGYPGYPDWETYTYLPLDQLNAAAHTQIDALIVELGVIDTQITNALPDSMAQKVGDLSISYTQHLAILKNEGSIKLHQISQLTGLKIAFNKYASGKKRHKFSPC